MTGSRKPDIRRVRVSRTYSVQEIAELLGVHPNTIRRWFRKGASAQAGSAAEH